MFCDSLLAAPFAGKAGKRELALPQGSCWYEIKTELWHKGGSKIEITGIAGEMPLFVKENSLLPLAEPVQCVNSDTVFKITVKVFGRETAPFSLIEDDGETSDYQTGAMNRFLLTWDPVKGGRVERTGSFSKIRYDIVAWEPMKKPDSRPAAR